MAQRVEIMKGSRGLNSRVGTFGNVMRIYTGKFQVPELDSFDRGGARGLVVAASQRRTSRPANGRRAQRTDSSYQTVEVHRLSARFEAGPRSVQPLSSPIDRCVVR